jgi:hypothetical protein
MSNLRDKLKISEERLQEVNDMLTDPGNKSVGQIRKKSTAKQPKPVILTTSWPA